VGGKPNVNTGEPNIQQKVGKSKYCNDLYYSPNTIRMIEKEEECGRSKGEFKYRHNFRV
jgi:hypothetical protein